MMISLLYLLGHEGLSGDIVFDHNTGQYEEDEDTGIHKVLEKGFWSSVNMLQVNEYLPYRITGIRNFSYLACQLNPTAAHLPGISAPSISWNLSSKMLFTCPTTDKLWKSLTDTLVFNVA